MKPHYYQDDAVESLFEYFRSSSGNPIIAMPTATGKSVVIAHFLKKAFQAYPFQKVLVLTHVKELIGQNFKRIKDFWPQAPAGINSAGLNQRDFHHPIIFAGIKSVVSHLDRFGKIDLILIDECHLVGNDANSDYLKTIAFLKEVNPKLKVIGLTATHWRQGMGSLTNGGIFTDVCYDLTQPTAFRRLIAEGFLSPLIPKQTHQFLDVTGVHMQNGDFHQGELQHSVDKYEITLAALKEAVELGWNRRKWMIFSAGVEHSIHCAEILTDLGIECKAVHSKLKGKERDDTIKEFLNGDLQAVSNNNCLTTGFDNPKIDLIVVLRPTTSVGLWVQMMGRGTRPFYAPGYDLSSHDQRLAAIQEGGKTDCLVLDFARNTKRLGPINDPYIPKQKQKGKGEAPVKVCGNAECNAYNHASVLFCEYCGYEFPPPVTKINSTSSTDQIIKGELPIVNEFEVDRVTYATHQGRDGKPDTMKVTYYCGLQFYHEFICVEHPAQSYMRRKAEEWWNKRCPIIMPDTISSCLYLSHLVTPPTHIRVWINKKYPEIMSYCFDGSMFGKKEKSESRPSTGVEGSYFLQE